MKNNNEKLSKTDLIIGFFIEIAICLAGFSLLAIFIKINLKHISLIIFVFMCAYFICRNYFFISVSSAILGIRWKKNILILLKNIIYISLIILLLVIRPIFIKIIIGLIINADTLYMFIKGKLFLDQCFKLESYKIKK